VIQLFRDPHCDVIGRRLGAYVVSGLAVLLSLGSLAAHGLRYDVDFTGGTLVQVGCGRTGPRCPPAASHSRSR
jgi:preprotein translocase subunit SecF